MTDLFRLRNEVDFTSVALITLLVNERSELIFEVHKTVMFIKVELLSEIFLYLTEAATEVR